MRSQTSSSLRTQPASAPAKPAAKPSRYPPRSPSAFAIFMPFQMSSPPPVKADIHCDVNISTLLATASFAANAAPLIEPAGMLASVIIDPSPVTSSAKSITDCTRFTGSSSNTSFITLPKTPPTFAVIPTIGLLSKMSATSNMGVAPEPRASAVKSGTVIGSSRCCVGSSGTFRTSASNTEGSAFAGLPSALSDPLSDSDSGTGCELAPDSLAPSSGCAWTRLLHCRPRRYVVTGG